MTNARLNLFRQALMEKHLNIGFFPALSAAMVFGYCTYG
jgi:hypothetical protein